MAYVTHTLIDHSGEKSPTRHYLPDLTNANYIAVTGNTPVTQNVGSLRVALGAITNANFVRHKVTAHTVRLPFSTPVAAAQRESKLLIRCQDNSNARRFNIEIPCPNLTLLAQEGTDVIDSTVPEWIAVVALLESECVSPWGNTFLVTEARIVGRRL